MTLWLGIAVALQSLRANRLRSALAMLGIVLGVAAVITMMAVGAGARTQVREQMKSLGANVLVILSGTTTSSGVRLGMGSRPTVTESDAVAIAREVPSVVAAAPLLRGSAQAVHGNINWGTQLLGIGPTYFEARDWWPVAGRPLTEADGDVAAKVALLGQTTARELFGPEDPIGRTIRIQRMPFTVVGVLETKGQNLWGSDQDDVILMPIATARKRVIGVNQANPRSVSNITVKVDDGADIKVAIEDIRRVMRQRHRLQADKPDDFSIRNLSEVLQARDDTSRVFGLLLAAVASVSLLVGGIGIMNIMLVTVTERTREIGLRMAVGARSRDILTQFLIEAGTLSVIGGLMGVAVGIAGALMIGDAAGWRIVIEPQAVGLAVGFSVGVGVFFGYYPAHKAARMLPMEALRRE